MLDMAVTTLPGIGPKLAKAYERLGILTLKDLLLALPFRYEDFRTVSGIGELEAGQTTTVQGTVTAVRSRRSPRKKMTLTEVTVEDGTGSITAVWFHQPYIAKTLKVGDRLSLSGSIDDRYGLSIVNPQYEKLAPNQQGVHTGRLVPIYSVSGKMAQKGRRTAVRNALMHRTELVEWIPADVQETYDLLPLKDAVKELHFPESSTQFDRAIRRMKFGELLLHQLSHLRARDALLGQEGRSIGMDTEYLRTFVESLPFVPTDAQRKAIFAIVKDMEAHRPMHRLLEGDVGSGKTVVAAAVMGHVANAGVQCAYLAPTELLAKQQGTSLREHLLGTAKVAVLTNSVQQIDGEDVRRDQILEALIDGRVQVLVGTHALLTGDVQIPELGLVVVDEQHRFGVEQRKRLLAPDKYGRVPHFLSMTATPIPRTLAMALYGDMDISILDELPKGRGEVETILLRPGQDASAYVMITEALDRGEQAYVVCPFIEESDSSEAASVTELTERLQKGALKAYRVEVVHGGLKPADKDAIMQRFHAGEVQVLVATTVIEVGINVPNATVIFIEGADRFGLAQLHQLRGRVRRSDKRATCFLHPRSMSGTTKQRMEAMVEHDDGFALAEIDLKLRGAGDRLGTRQSGLEAFQYATLADSALIAQTQELAERLLQEDGSLARWPDLQKEFEDALLKHRA